MDTRPASRADLEVVCALLGARPAEVLVEWAAPGFELPRDAWIAEEGGDAVGYAALRADGLLVQAAASPGAAEALLERAAARARERGLRRLLLSCGAEEELPRRHPFVHVRTVLTMTRPLDRPVPPPSWPDGVSVRPFEDADAEAVHRLLDEAYGEWDGDHAPLPHADWVRSMTGDPEFDRSVWWVAERAGAPVGCALHWSSGWLKDLAVRAPERGRGLGAALVTQGLAEFARRGLPRVGLKVDAANPTGALRLYERLGFTTERREDLWASSL